MVTILVSAKANETRLNNLILLIAISYTINSFQVQKVKNKGVQEYISRTIVIPNKSGILFQLKPFHSKKILSQSKSEWL